MKKKKEKHDILQTDWKIIGAILGKISFWINGET